MSFSVQDTRDRHVITTESEEWKRSYFVQTENARARDRRESLQEIAELVARAWKRIGPGVMKDRDELMARLARRRSAMLNRPPRAWCAAIRAGDTRINSAHAVIVPEDAMDRREHRDGDEPAVIQAHAVTLDARLVRWLCRPVWCDWPYSTLPELMKRLGWTRDRLDYAMGTGVFEVRKIPHLDGKRGRPVPVVYTHRPLDPGAQKGQYADVVWGTTIRWVCDHIPDELMQEVQRVPEIGPAWSLHLKRRVERFKEWKWICPACGKRCRTIFLPMRPMALVELLPGGEIHRKDPNHPDAISPGCQTFACGRCHGVMQGGRLDARAWNRLISHISGGLLYGHQVERPAWFEFERKRRFVPRINRAPSRRRAEVRELLEGGLRYREIAMRLGISYSRAADYGREIFRQEGMRSVAEFRREKMRGWENGVERAAVGSRHCVIRTTSH